MVITIAITVVKAVVFIFHLMQHPEVGVDRKKPKEHRRSGAPWVLFKHYPPNTLLIVMHKEAEK